MKMIKKIFGSKTTWISVVVGALALVYVVVMGGSTTQTFPGKNGAEYEVQLQIAEGVIELAEQCKLKEIGQECEVAINVKVKMTKVPIVSAELVKEEAKPVPTPVVPAETKKIEVEEVDKAKILKAGTAIAPVKTVNKEKEVIVKAPVKEPVKAPVKKENDK